MQAVAAGLTAATATHEYEQKGSTFVTRSQRGENGEWTSNDFVADGSVVTGNDDVRTSPTLPRVQKFERAAVSRSIRS